MLLITKGSGTQQESVVDLILKADYRINNKSPFGEVKKANSNLSCQSMANQSI